MTQAPGSNPSSPSAIPALLRLVQREWLRFARQPTRIVAAIGTPALLWLVFGSGFAGSFAIDQTSGAAAGGGGGAMGYSAYLIPGMATMIVLFSSIFAAMSLIEDRQAGFLQSILVSSAPRSVVVASKIGANAVLSTAQAALILAAAPVVGLAPGVVGFLLAFAALALISCGLTGLGLAAAWKVNSTQGYHGVMNLILMPMWLLSGAVFPLAGAAGWITWVMRVNPLTWGTEALRGALAGTVAPLPWLGAIAFAAAGVVVPAVTIARASRV